MQKAWVSVLYLICGLIWDWGKRELIATNRWYALISIVWIIFLFWTDRKKKKRGSWVGQVSFSLGEDVKTGEKVKWVGERGQIKSMK